MPFPFLPLAIGGAAGLGFMGSMQQNSANREMNEQTNAMNLQMSREATEANRGMAVDQLRHQERMSNTAYQRAMEDMRMAGLNPMLAFQQGGATSPMGNPGYAAQGSAQSARMENVLSGPISTALETRRLRKDIEATDADVALKKATKVVAETQAKSNVNSARKTALEADALKARLPVVKSGSKVDEKMVIPDAIIKRINDLLGGGAANNVRQMIP